jgi:hypothetical protein
MGPIINPKPVWAREVGSTELLWPGRVWLIGQLVVGEWFCLARVDGATVWTADVAVANCILGEHDGILLGSTVGPGFRPSRGACGLRLSDGRLAWSEPLHVLSCTGSSFLCADGIVRDIVSSEPRGHQLTKEHAMVSPPETPHSGIVRAEVSDQAPHFGGGVRVALRASRTMYCGLDAAGATVWQFSLEDAGWFCGMSRFDRNAVPPHIFFVASRVRPFRQLSMSSIEFIRCERFLLVLDARIGELVQTIPSDIVDHACSRTLTQAVSC